ncbi:LOW QUALITY PROTEIN: Pol Polyprotein [Phytophthora megakarya]|uniref:Pol Polyprotein n=1 Tax=Phytophthora megakarya TaxID=4795 RepID=A0A225WKN2_9STRA|nr:LOW QUALITY PROTEIN: Pol Polyprotein [Phytophthora megakarya]
MSIASAHASSPASKGSTSRMSTSRRCACSGILVGNPLPEPVKVTVFMDGLRVSPARTQLFCVQASTIEEAIQVALEEEYSHSQARTLTSACQGHSVPGRVAHGSPGNGASGGLVPMDLGLAEQSDIHCFVCGRLGHMKRACPAGGQRKFSSRSHGSKGRWHKPRPKGQGNAGHHAHRGGLVRESLCTLETEKGNGGLPFVYVNVRGYDHPLRVLIDSGASKNFARRQTVARNRDLFAAALRESKGNGGSRRETGRRYGVPKVRMDLAVKFEDFDSTEPIIVLDMDKYDLILGMPSMSLGSIRGSTIEGLVGYQPEVRKGLEPGTKALRSPPVEECYHVFDGETGKRVEAGTVSLQVPPEVSQLLNLEEVAMEDFLVELKTGEISEMVLLRPETSPEEFLLGNGRGCPESSILKNPKDLLYPLVKEYADVVSKNPRSQFPPDRGIRHEIDLVLCHQAVRRNRCLPRRKAKAGMVRKSQSPGSTSTLCVRKPNGKWRLVHAYNNLDSATVPAQTPIPRKDVLLNNMSGCTLYSALDLVDGYYQILMRESRVASRSPQ